jgi:hypothetical protein|tara:strand:+ start:831 stop:1070 length:240 start_codon:yes stop_codon:yes gene_type:complete
MVHPVQPQEDILLVEVAVEETLQDVQELEELVVAEKVPVIIPQVWQELQTQVAVAEVEKAVILLVTARLVVQGLWLLDM